MLPPPLCRAVGSAGLRSRLRPIGEGSHAWAMAEARERLRRASARAATTHGGMLMTRVPILGSRHHAQHAAWRAFSTRPASPPCSRRRSARRHGRRCAACAILSGPELAGSVSRCCSLSRATDRRARAYRSPDPADSSCEPRDDAVYPGWKNQISWFKYAMVLVLLPFVDPQR